MGREERFKDRDLEQLFAGRVPEDDGRLGPLAAFIERAQEAYREPVPDEVAESHLAAIVAAARSEEIPSLVQTSGPTDPKRLRRRTMLSTVFASLGAKVAAAALVAVTGSGAAAATGTLPDPAQSAVANAVEKVGISIPNPDDEVTATDEGEEVETDSDGKRVDSDVRDVVEDDSLTGREKGEKVADTADQNRQDDGRRPETTPADGSAGEQGTSNNPTDYGQDNHPTGEESGSDAGQETGDEQAEQGPSNNPTGQGRP